MIFLVSNDLFIDMGFGVFNELLYRINNIKYLINIIIFDDYFL